MLSVMSPVYKNEGIRSEEDAWTNGGKLKLKQFIFSTIYVYVHTVHRFLSLHFDIQIFMLHIHTPAESEKGLQVGSHIKGPGALNLAIWWCFSNIHLHPKISTLYLYTYTFYAGVCASCGSKTRQIKNLCLYGRAFMCTIYKKYIRRVYMCRFMWKIAWNFYVITKKLLIYNKDLVYITYKSLDGVNFLDISFSWLPFFIVTNRNLIW